VFAQGADSHEDDDLGGQCTTAEWLEASSLVYGMLDRIGARLGKPIPLTLSLFGGYREDNYEAVLRIHTADLIRCLQIVCHRRDEDLQKLFKLVSVIDGSAAE
jgi:hypothetical protein